MIIVHMLGGFASQLRQFNIAYEIAETIGTAFGIDLCDYENGYFRPYVLSLINLPQCEYPSKSRIRSAQHVHNGRELLEWFENDCLQANDLYIDGETIAFGDFFDKYPQFCLSKESRLLATISLKKQSRLVTEFSDIVAQTFSIGVHIRLGDFENVGWKSDFDFYKSRLGFLLKRNPESKVYFFSNEIGKVIDEFGKQPNFYYMNHHNGYVGDIEEFLCFAMCKEKVISPKSGYSTLAVELGIMAYDALDVLNFSEKELETGLKYLEEYSEIRENAGELHMLGDVIPREIRPDVIEKNPEYFTEKERIDFWQKELSIVPKTDTIYVYSSIINYNRWFISNLYKDARNMARVGARVLFIANRCNDSCGIPENVITEARDMDEKSLGFDLYVQTGERRKCKDIIEEWTLYREIDKCNVKLTRDSLIVLMKKLIEHMLETICF